MSHNSTIDLQIKDEKALRKAIGEIEGARILGPGVHKLYGSNQARGFGVMLPGFKYPVVVDFATGKATTDYFLGDRLVAEQNTGKLKQEYAVAVAMDHYAAQNKDVERMQLPNGDVKLRIHVGGGYATGDEAGNTTSGGYAVA